MVTCPGEEVLVRFGQGALSVDERGSILDHAASCEQCHAALAVALSTVGSRPRAALVALAAGVQIDRYLVTSVLGRGAMGVVYVAHDPELGRDVALKLLPRDASPVRLRREAQALAKLAHPNVVRVYDIGEHDGQTFIAMELVVGANLRAWLATPRAVPAILAVLVAAGRGLAAAHAAGLVHRDFKPDNVFVADRGDVLVGDFGLAHDTALPASDGVAGTPAYMPPEQLAGHATAASDQFAFCVTAWEALFGARPYQGATLAELRARMEEGAIARPGERDVPRAVEEALRRGLAADPTARFASLDELLRELAPPPRRRTWLLGAALGALALGGGAATWLATRGDDAVACERAGAELAPAWSPQLAGLVAGRLDGELAGALGRYASQWQAARIDACRATHERHAQSPAALDVRIACLDRARATLGTTVATLVAGKEALPRPDAVLDTLPDLGTCDGARAIPLPPPSLRPAIAALEAELTVLEVWLATGTPSLSLAQTIALRERAERLGHPSTLLHARVLEAQVAAWTGDRAGAEAILRDAIVRAERIGDDATRAFASALLARTVAATHGDEAIQLVASGRAALARAGGDRVIEAALLSAEVAVVHTRGDARAAAGLQEKLIALLEARSTSSTRSLVNAYGHLSTLWAVVPDPARSSAASARALALAAAMSPGADPQAVFSQSVMDRLTAGDLAGALELGRRQLAVMRAAPEPPRRLIGYTLDMMLTAIEADLDYAGCVALAREVEDAWSLPLEAYAFPGEAVNAEEVARQRTDAAIIRGDCARKAGQLTEAVRSLRHARELALAGRPATDPQLPQIDRLLGIALVDAGDARAGRALLEPLVPWLSTSPSVVSHAYMRFALARALWLDAGMSERPRALALAHDAVADLDTALVTPELASGALRKLPVVLREQRAQIVAWIAVRER